MKTKATVNVEAIKIFQTKEKMQIGMLVITINNKNIVKFCRKQDIKQSHVLEQKSQMYDYFPPNIFSLQNTRS